MPRPRASALILVFAVLLGACSGPLPRVAPASAPAKGEFVGQAGTLGAIGISTDGQQVIAYLCDGADRQVTVAEWFKGPVTGAGLDLTNPHGARLRASMSAQAFAGAVALKGGRSASFTARLLATPDSAEGLFRSAQSYGGVSYVGGWILFPSFVATDAPRGARPTFGVLISITCCNPEDRGGIVNQQSGALIPAMVDMYSPDSVTVPNLGPFRLTPCRQGQC